MTEKYLVVDINNRECGPFSMEELSYMRLYRDSLIYCSEWEERKELSQISELANVAHNGEFARIYNPEYGKNVIMKNTIKNKSIDKTEKINPNSFKNRKVRTFIVSWLFFHLLSLIFASFGIQNSERSKNWSYKNFWPNVDFFRDGENWHPTFSEPYNRPYSIFNGIFYQYDIS
jgi:hypothetical protein